MRSLCQDMSKTFAKLLGVPGPERYISDLESQRTATGLRTPKSPGRVLGRVPGKRGLLGGLLGAVPFLWFSKETGSTLPGTFGDLGVLSPVALCCPCPARGPKPPENSSSWPKVGPKVGSGVPLQVGQKYRNLCTFDLLLTYFQGPSETYFRTYFWSNAWIFRGFGGFWEDKGNISPVAVRWDSNFRRCLGWISGPQGLRDSWSQDFHFLLQRTPGAPRKVSSERGLWRAHWRGHWRVLVLVGRRTLPNPFKKRPSRTLENLSIHSAAHMGSSSRRAAWLGAHPPPSIRSFEKGLADRGGWREEILERPEIQASFLYLFSYAPLGEGGHISGDVFGFFWGACLSPTPSRQPLFETGVSRALHPKDPVILKILRSY